MRLAGLEPAAQGLGTPCSILLSYRRNLKGASVADSTIYVLCFCRAIEREVNGSETLGSVLLFSSSNQFGTKESLASRGRRFLLLSLLRTGPIMVGHGPGSVRNAG